MQGGPHDLHHLRDLNYRHRDTQKKLRVTDRYDERNKNARALPTVFGPGRARLSKVLFEFLFRLVSVVARGLFVELSVLLLLLVLL